MPKVLYTLLAVVVISLFCSVLLLIVYFYNPHLVLKEPTVARILIRISKATTRNQPQLQSPIVPVSFLLPPNGANTPHYNVSGGGDDDEWGIRTPTTNPMVQVTIISPNHTKTPHLVDDVTTTTTATTPTTTTTTPITTTTTTAAAADGVGYDDNDLGMRRQYNDHINGDHTNGCKFIFRN